jgi:hypothetical protein
LVVLWLNEAGDQAVAVWQTSQVWGNPAAACGGLLAPWKSFKWHETQVVGRAANWPLAWHAEQASEVWAPTSGNLVLLWLKTALSQSVVEWQTEQSVGNPAVTWLGLFVALNVARWQPAHCVEVFTKSFFTWHCAQGVLTCAPVSGNLVVLWLKVAGDQAVVVWHTSHVVGKPEATWFGLVVVW